MAVTSRIQKATRKKALLRLALDGGPGTGKSFTALRFAFALGKRVGFISTEPGAAELYVGNSPDGIPWDFDIITLTKFAPTDYTSAIQEFADAKYDVLIIDSLTHEWTGTGGALEMKDKAGQSYYAWKDVTPLHNRMFDAILTYPGHVIATIRSKTAYLEEEETDARGNKKKVIRKHGTEPIQRPGAEYEFGIYASMDQQHVMRVTKTRCPAIDGAVVPMPGATFMRPVIQWLEMGVEAPVVPPTEMQRQVKAEQVERIKTLLGKLPEASRTAGMKVLREKYHVSDFAELLESDANAIEASLTAKVGALPPATNGQAATAPPEPSAATAPATPPGEDFPHGANEPS